MVYGGHLGAQQQRKQPQTFRSSTSGGIGGHLGAQQLGQGSPLLSPQQEYGFPGAPSGQVQQAYNYTSPYEQSSQFFTGLYGPRDILAQQAIEGIQGQIGMTGSAAEMERGFLGQENSLAQRALELSKGGNQRDIDAILRQMGVSDEDRKAALRDTRSQHIARGAMFSEGYGWRQGDIHRKFDEEKARLRDREAALRDQAKSYGIDAERLKMQLEQGLARLNLGQIVDVSKLMDMLNDKNVERRMLAEQIIRDSMQYQGQFPGAKTPVEGPPAGYQDPGVAALLQGAEGGSSGGSSQPTRRLGGPF